MGLLDGLKELIAREEATAEEAEEEKVEEQKEAVSQAEEEVAKAEDDSAQRIADLESKIAAMEEAAKKRPGDPAPPGRRLSGTPSGPTAGSGLRT